MRKANLPGLTKLRFLLIALVVIVPLVLTLWRAYAATRTWDGDGGAGNPGWMTATNWVGNVAPVAGDDLVFPATPGGTANNNFPAGTSFGKLTMNGGYVLSGNSTVLAGGIEATAGLINFTSLRVNFIDNPTAGKSVAIASDINNNGTNLGLDGAGNILITGDISNVGTLIINSGQTGIVTLTGDNPFTGPTSHAGNTLRIEGDQRNSPISIGAGAILEGGGHTGSITNTNNATVSPGGSSNFLTAHGNVTFNSNATLKIARQPSSGVFGVLRVLDGEVRLGGSTLNFIPGSPTPAAGQTIFLISNEGSNAVVGTFNGLPEGSSFSSGGTTFYISYLGGNGNDVVLHVPTTRTWDGGGPDPNWMTAANWEGDVAPGVADDLVFLTSPAGLVNNNFPAGTSFGKLTKNSGGLMTGNSAIFSGGVEATSGIIGLSSIRTNNITNPTSGTAFAIIGGIDNSGSSNVVFSGAGNVTMAGVISNISQLFLSSNLSGTVTLSGNNTYTAPTTLSGGTLRVEGSQPNSQITLFGNGTLRGGGTTGPIGSFGSGGKLSPGKDASDSVLTAVGNVTLSTSITFEVLPQGGSGPFGQLNVVNGTVNLGGATLSVIASQTPPSPGQIFTIIDNDGADALVGAFNGLPEGSSFSSGGTIFLVSYLGGDGNDVVLRVSTSRTWDGGGADSNWMTAANWVGDVAPAVGNDLVFPAGAARLSNTNNFPAGTTFNSITLSGPPVYSLSGNSIGLNAGITATAGNHVLSLPIRLLANQSFSSDGVSTNLSFTPASTIDTNGRTLTLAGNGGHSLSGVISGSGELIKNGLTRSDLLANNTYTGITTILDGSLGIAGLQPASPIQLAGGTLSGNGTVGAINATAGSLSPLSNSFTGILNVSGNVNLSSATTLNADLGGTTAGSGHDQLNVTGAVSLGGSRLAVRLLSGFTPSSGNTFVVINNDGADPVNGTFTGLPEGAAVTAGGNQFTVSYLGGDGNDVTLALVSGASAVVQFSSSNYNVNEDCTTVTITVNRIGDTSGAASVDYNTSDVTATERKDYITALGKLSFAPNETSKSFVVLINEDSLVEGNETANVNLSNPSGATLGAPVMATVTINDDSAEPATNVIDDPGSYVCQHYHDFLNRQPDAPGHAFWTNEITSCGSNQGCVEIKRINVSASFFLSIEFQGTGYLVERIYKAAYGDATSSSTFPNPHQLPVPIVRLNEFLLDTQQIGQGVIVGQGNWEQIIENNKLAFTAEFVQRARFATAFPPSMTTAQFVDTLNQNGGNPLSQSERDVLVSQLTNGVKTRAQVLRAVAEDSDLDSAEFNRAFVLMQYFGYLRRNPNDPQDTDYTGYDFWLTKLNQFNGNFINAEMVKAFITSIEYRNRFGP